MKWNLPQYNEPYPLVPNADLSADGGTSRTIEPLSLDTGDSIAQLTVNCGVCNGTGRYVGLIESSDCEACEGTGRVAVERGCGSWTVTPDEPIRLVFDKQFQADVVFQQIIERRVGHPIIQVKVSCSSQPCLKVPSRGPLMLLINDTNGIGRVILHGIGSLVQWSPADGTIDAVNSLFTGDLVLAFEYIPDC